MFPEFSFPNQVNRLAIAECWQSSLQPRPLFRSHYVIVHQFQKFTQVPFNSTDNFFGPGQAIRFSANTLGKGANPLAFSNTTDGFGYNAFSLPGDTKFDLAPQTQTNGVFDFTGKNAASKNALLNWGIAAIVYLLIGRFGANAIAPKSSR